MTTTDNSQSQAGDDKPRFTRVAAYGLVLDGERILLCQLSRQVARYHGQWTLPGGGVEFGEAPVDAMVREVREETGLRVSGGRVACVDSYCADRDGRLQHGIRIVFHTRVLGGVLSNEIDGTTERCAWWSREQAGELALVALARVGLAVAFPDN